MLMLPVFLLVFLLLLLLGLLELLLLLMLLLLLSRKFRQIINMLLQLPHVFVAMARAVVTAE